MAPGNTEYTVVKRVIEEHPGAGRTGRHVFHDSRSKDYPADEATKIIDVLHAAHGLPLYQADVGSCTGESVTGCCDIEPNYKSGAVLKTQQDAYHVYHDETVAEGQPWPPNDPGGSGLAVCKAALKLGWLKSYRHAFGIEHALKSLVLRPVMFGTDWHEGMDRPDSNGLVTIDGQVRGGHEWTGIGIDIAQKEIVAVNSWGLQFGVALPKAGLQGGAFRVKWSDLDSLLQSQGDCTVPYVV